MDNVLTFKPKLTRKQREVLRDHFYDYTIEALVETILKSVPKEHLIRYADQLIKDRQS